MQQSNARVTVYLPNTDSGCGAREYNGCENVTFYQRRVEFDGIYCGQRMHVVTGHPYLYEETQQRENPPK
jgi:hypothetical protein